MNGGDPNKILDDLIQLYRTTAANLIDRAERAEAEVARLKGLMHSETICEMHYCELHEMAFQRGEGAPPTCPYCEVDELRAALEERESDMHIRIRLGYDKTVADIWREKLTEAIDFAEEGWSYATPFFREKHGYTKRLAALRAAAKPRGSQ